ncbi:MAG: phosphoribosylamine--glycine ligase, partial [Alphaproteobacteria bacterium]
MRVLVVGGGGREHALVWALEGSALVDALFCAPGNPGIAALASCVPLAADDTAGLVAWAKSNAIDLVVVGPEQPLAAGLVDALAAAGLRAFGPTAAAARLESSKAFAREFCRRHGIPGA